MQAALTSAHAERQAAASEYSRTRSAAAREAYRSAHERMRAVHDQAGKRASQLTGKAYNDTNYIFPSYVLSRLSGGLAGLVMAVIFAAAMSTLAGEFNSVATATHGRLLPALRAHGGERRALPVGVAALHGALGRLRLPGRAAGGQVRLGHRGGEPVRVVLLRLDPGRLRARHPHAPGVRARRVLRARSPAWWRCCWWRGSRPSRSSGTTSSAPSRCSRSGSRSPPLFPTRRAAA